MGGSTASSIKLQPSFLKDKKSIFLTGIVFFLAFFLFTFLVKKDLFTKLDFNLTVKIQDKFPRRADRLMSFFASVGKFEVVLTLLLIILFLRKKILGIVAFMLFGLAHLAEVFLKYVLHQPPPPYLFYRNNNPTSFAKDYINPGSSYPSGHSFRAIFMFILLSYLVFLTQKLSTQKKWLVIASVFVVSSMIIFSKIVLGEHWPTDIIGGIILGLSFGLLSILFI